jgi:ATP-dependent protease ClpP protease subunit
MKKLTTLLCLLSTLSLYSAEVSLYENTIEIWGEIDAETLPSIQGQFKKITNKVSEELKLRVLLSSGGGLTGSGLNIHGFLRWLSDKHKVEVTTIVPQFEDCSSACLSIFAAGDIRLSHQDSEFGFHASHNGTPGDQTGYDVEGATKQYRESLERTGILPYLDEVGVLKKADVTMISGKTLQENAPSFVEIDNEKAAVKMKTRPALMSPLF